MAKRDLTPEQIKELLSYDPETGDFTWIKKLSGKANQIVVGSKAGNISDQGYIRIYIGRANYRAHRLAWFFVHGEMPPIIDHINGIRTDNRISNLRPATHTLNMQNRVFQRSKRPVGVRETDQGRFTSVIWVTLDGKEIKLYLGTYDTEDEAYRVYSEAKTLVHPGAILVPRPSLHQRFNVADVPVSLF